MVNIQQPTIDDLIIKVRELISSITLIIAKDQNAPAATELVSAKSKLVKVLCDTLMAKEAQQNRENYIRILNDITTFNQD